MLSILKNNQLVLASGSPRRKELLEKLGISFEVCVSDIDETIDDTVPVLDELERLALQKAMSVSCGSSKIIIGADTIVLKEKEIMGKPETPEDAFLMLKRLNGCTHQVVTAYAFYDNEREKTYSSHIVTNVSFFDLSDEEINWYITEENIFDKAGSYAIQEKGMMLVEKIEGSYTNIVGFPVEYVLRDLEDFVRRD